MVFLVESRPSLRSATKVSFSPKPSLIVNLFKPGRFRSEHVLTPSTRLAPVPLDDWRSRIGRFTPSSTENCRLSVRLRGGSLVRGNHEGCLSKLYASIGQCQEWVWKVLRIIGRVDSFLNKQLLKPLQRVTEPPLAHSTATPATSETWRNKWCGFFRLAVPSSPRF